MGRSIGAGSSGGSDGMGGYGGYGDLGIGNPGSYGGVNNPGYTSVGGYSLGGGGDTGWSFGDPISKIDWDWSDLLKDTGGTAKVIVANFGISVYNAFTGNYEPTGMSAESYMKLADDIGMPVTIVANDGTYSGTAGSTADTTIDNAAANTTTQQNTNSGTNTSTSNGDYSDPNASDAENFLVNIIMEMYTNPEATPVSAMNNYLEKYQIADDFYTTFPEYAESKLSPALQKYKDEMDRVNNMQGVGLKFNGSPVRTGDGTQAQILPLKKMEFLRDNAGKVFEADTGIQQKLLDAATSSMNTRMGLAQDRLTQVVDPVTQMWQTALAARYGVNPPNEVWEPSVGDYAAQVLTDWLKG